MKTKKRVGNVKFKEFPEERFFFTVGQQKVIVPVQEEGNEDSKKAAKGLISEIHKELVNNREYNEEDYL